VLAWLGGCDWPRVTAFVIGFAVAVLQKIENIFTLAGRYGSLQAGL